MNLLIYCHIIVKHPLLLHLTIQCKVVFTVELHFATATLECEQDIICISPYTGMITSFLCHYGWPDNLTVQPTFCNGFVIHERKNTPTFLCRHTCTHVCTHIHTCTTQAGTQTQTQSGAHRYIQTYIQTHAQLHVYLQILILQCQEKMMFHVAFHVEYTLARYSVLGWMWIDSSGGILDLAGFFYLSGAPPK